MADTDGKIQLAVELSPEKAQQSAQRLQKSIQQAIDGISTKSLDSKGQKLEATVSKLASKSQTAVQKLNAALDNTKVPTQEFTQLTETIEASKNKIAELKSQMELSKEAGFSESQLQPFTDQIAALERNIDQSQQKMTALVEAGKAFTFDETAESVVKARNDVADLNNEMRVGLSALSEYSGQMDTISAQRAQEVQAQAEEIAKLLEIKLNAGEINQEIGDTVARIQEIQAELDQLYARQQDLEQAGAGLGYAEYDQNLATIRQLETEMGNLTQRVQDYRTEQENAQPQIGVWDRVGALFRQLGQDLRHPIQAIRRTADATAEAGANATEATGRFRSFGLNASQSLKPLTKTLTSLAKQFIVSVSHIDKFKSKFDGLTRRVEKNNFSFKKLFNTLMRYGLGIRGTFMLFRKLRSALLDNIKYFAMFNNGSNQVNESISQMQTSLNALKGAWAGAFVPIINVVSPILSNFMDQLASVITAIGMFIARLTGAKSYMLATKKATNYAASQNKNSGGNGKTQEEKQAEVDEKRAKEAAKAEEKQAEAAEKLAKAQAEANKELQGFDELNNIALDKEKDIADYTEKEYKDPTSSGSGSGGAPFNMEEVPLEDLEFDWDWLKKKAEELGRKFANFLNDIFADEDLAKKIGETIAELLNVALHFAYGFVDELNWKQMGHWLGTLVQAGIETFEWELLGETIAKFLNGIADTIIGFFERYQVGTLGSSIAAMLNKAIEIIDPVKIGTALNEILKAPFIELSTFLVETNWRELGGKFTTFIHNALTSDALNRKSLGATIGQAFADVVNAGIQLLLGADIQQAVADLTLFFGDMIREALMGIDWLDLLTVIWQGIVGVIAGFLQGLITTLLDIILDAIEEGIPSLTGKIEAARANMHAELEAAFDETVAAFTGTADEAERQSDRFNHAIADMIDYMTDWSSGGAVDWNNALKDIQEQYKFTDEDMDTLIETFAAMDQKFNDSQEILEDYEGSWEDYKVTLEDTPESVNIAKEKQEELNDAVKSVGDTANETSDSVKDYVKIASEEMETGQQNAQEYSSTTVEALDAVGEKSQDVKSDVSDMADAVKINTEALTAIIEEWYNAVAADYFSFDKWYNLLHSSMYVSMELVLTEMTTFWNIAIAAWYQNNALPQFTVERWTMIFTNIRTAWMQVWTAIYRDWTTKFTAWWTATLVPAFSQARWEIEFNHVYKGAEKSFVKVVDVIRDRMDEAVDIVVKASETMAEALQEIAVTVENITSALGSLGSLNLNAVQINIPHLAQGAVIPPNREFMAVLGDQKSGTNIEAPLDTIKQAFMETLSTANYNNQDIVVQIDGYEVFRAVRTQSERFRNSTGYGVL